jgi:uncharacterized protein YprB with RNaseH-like and TPR domain
MQVSAITTKTSRHEIDLQAVFKDLVASKTPFNVQISFVGREFPVPFINGKAANGCIEASVRSLLKAHFGTVEYEYNYQGV